MLLGMRLLRGYEDPVRLWGCYGGMRMLWQHEDDKAIRFLFGAAVGLYRMYKLMMMLSSNEVLRML